jgi:hypothetical protein
MYKLTLALGLASSALVASQSTTTLLLLGFDTQTIDANIVGSVCSPQTSSVEDADRTGLALRCCHYIL